MQRIYQGYDVRVYKEKLEKAVFKYGLPMGASPSLLRDLDYRVLDFLGYMQPTASRYWQIYLYHALVDGGIHDRFDIYPTTILDRYWHFGERNWRFAPGKIEYQVRRALNGLNYLVMIEFEIFGNVRFPEEFKIEVSRFRDQGRVIAPHVQGLIWGKRPSRQQRAQFAGGMFGAHGTTLRSLTDFAGAIRYMVKPPKGGLLHPLPGGGNHRYPWEEMPLSLHHLLFRNLHTFSYPDLTFASGEGSRILAYAKRLWRDYSPVGLQRYSCPPTPFHRISIIRRTK